jgi:hypothetical protein
MLHSTSYRVFLQLAQEQAEVRQWEEDKRVQSIFASAVQI